MSSHLTFNKCNRVQNPIIWQTERCSTAFLICELQTSEFLVIRLCKTQVCVKDWSIRVYIWNSLLITRCHCSLSPPAMFVFFMGFLQRFLSPSQPWHQPDLRNTRDFRTTDTGQEHYGGALNCLGEDEDQDVLLRLWNVRGSLEH